LRRGAISVAVGLVLFTVVGFFVVPPVARRIAQTQLSQLLGRKVTIDRVRLNPFALSLAVEGFHIFEADARTVFVEFKRLYVNAEVASVYRRAPATALQSNLTKAVPGSAARLFLLKPRLDAAGARVDFRLKQE
jgi:hypothetical protein